MNSPRVHASLFDPDEVRRLLLNEITAAKSPVPIASLGVLQGLGRKVPASQIRNLLDGDIAAGSIFLWGTKSRPAFWNQRPEDVARDRLLRISAGEVLPKAALEKRAAGEAPKISAAVIKGVGKSLLVDGKLREVPAAAGSRGRRIINAGQPEPYLEAEISGLLERFGMKRSHEQIRALLTAEASQRLVAGSRDQQEDIREVADRMFEAMSRLAFSPGTTVTFFRLWQQPELAAIPKRLFDQAALRLQEERRALLSIHDHAQALPKEEQDRFVTDGQGHYYVSIYAR
jgi:hypothetical protein